MRAKHGANKPEKCEFCPRRYHVYMAPKNLMPLKRKYFLQGEEERCLEVSQKSARPHTPQMQEYKTANLRFVKRVCETGAREEIPRELVLQGSFSCAWPPSHPEAFVPCSQVAWLLFLLTGFTVAQNVTNVGSRRFPPRFQRKTWKARQGTPKGPYVERGNKVKSAVQSPGFT